MARATSSLPTPLSPRTSTVTSLSDTCSMTVAIPRIFSLFPQESILLDCVLDRDIQRNFSETFRIVGLHNVISRAQAYRFDNGRDLVPARQHDDLRFRPGRLQRAKGGDAVQARHHH